MMNSLPQLDTMPPLRASLAALMEMERRGKERRLTKMYPLTGPLRRELYPKHMQFFAAGAEYRQRLFIAANRVGKTWGGGLYELVLHCTGWYPDWWEGRRFDSPVDCWAVGQSGKEVREVIQMQLLGPEGAHGTGLIPAECIRDTRRSSGVAASIEIIYIKRKGGGESIITLKSYDQGPEAFMGAVKDIIALDEEPPMAVYVECLMRTMTNNGMIMVTFTPLLGMSDVVMSFLPEGKIIEGRVTDSKHVTTATWDDVPHLTAQAKKELWESIPPFQRDARSKGIPQLGAGAIYPISESDITIDDIIIPAHWPRGYAMDVGWNRTAALWGALDPQTDILYLYAEHYMGQAEPLVHAHAIKARGEWINGVIDPASTGASQHDGRTLMEAYRNLGLRLETADNAVEAGIFSVWHRMSTGRLKIFKSLANTLSESRLYRRDEKGKIVKVKDHLMDCLRYLVMSCIERMTIEHKETPIDASDYGGRGHSGSTSWMG